MRTKSLLVGSILLNLILAGWLLLRLGVRPGQPHGSSQATKVSPPASVALTPAPPPQPAQATRVVTFDWRQVESPDYKQYLANLRGIGCPEKTIKDIIVADVNDLFSSRSRSITATNQYQFWRKVPLSWGEEQRQQLRDLYAQKQEVLKTLGVVRGDASDFTDLLGEAFRDNLEEHELELAFLPEPKQQQVREALFQAAQQEVVGNDNSDTVEQQTQARLQSLLTPEEFKEYELRTSPDAVQLRGVLDPVDLTEQEFRVIFDSWRNLKAFSPGTAEYRAAQESNESNLQQLLGPERFQLYLGGVKLLGYSR